MTIVNIITKNGKISLERDTFIDISNKIELFKNMIEGIDYEDIGKEDIPLNIEEASYDNVSAIIDFLYNIIKTDEQNIETVEKKFIRYHTTKKTFELILLTNYLGCEYVLNLLCKSVANKIKECPDVEAVKREFAISSSSS